MLSFDSYPHLRKFVCEVVYECGLVDRYHSQEEAMGEAMLLFAPCSDEECATTEEWLAERTYAKLDILVSGEQDEVIGILLDPNFPCPLAAHTGEPVLLLLNGLV